ncbi:MAG: hypothetical protein GY772_31120 [bacterium]|nr:hypothetical protein [bacterium]
MNHYFELWLKCDKNWATVQVVEKKTQKESATTRGHYKWLRGDELDERLPSNIAAALKQTLKHNPDFYAEHPQLPGNEEAALFKVLVSADEEHSTERVAEQALNLNASISAGAPEEARGQVLELLGSHQVDRPAGGTPTESAKSPEEIAAAATEKAKQKEAREEQARIKKADPKHRARVWLQKLPADVQQAKNTQAEVTSNTAVPQEQRDEYEILFKAHAAKLSAFRAQIEDNMAVASYPLNLFQQADVTLCKLRADLKAWKALQEIFLPNGAE